MLKTVLISGLLVGCALAEISVKVSGLRVVSEAYEGKDRSDQIRAFSWSKGTSIALLVQNEGKGIVGLDTKSSKITMLSDDQGTDLLKVKRQYASGPYDFEFTNISKDGKALGTSLSFGGVAAKGAATLSLKGELLVSLASKSELKKSPKFAVKKGEKFELAGTKVELASAGKPKWGDALLEINLKSETPLKEFKSIKFFDADGKEVEAKENGSGSSGFLGKRTYTLSFSFKAKHENLIAGFEVWTDLEKVKVPLDLKVGAGL